MASVRPCVVAIYVFTVLGISSFTVDSYYILIQLAVLTITLTLMQGKESNLVWVNKVETYTTGIEGNSRYLKVWCTLS